MRIDEYPEITLRNLLRRMQAEVPRLLPVNIMMNSWCLSHRTPHSSTRFNSDNRRRVRWKLRTAAATHCSNNRLVSLVFFGGLILAAITIAAACADQGQFPELLLSLWIKETCEKNRLWKQLDILLHRMVPCSFVLVFACHRQFYQNFYSLNSARLRFSSFALSVFFLILLFCCLIFDD